MMTDDLTTADRFELLSAEHKDRGDVTEDVSIDRWTNYGKDRLYLNGLKTGDGWISLKSDDADGDKWTKVDARRELVGDKLTIEIHKGHTVYYTLVVRARGDGFAPSEDEDEDEDGADSQELVCDGGEDVTEHVSDETIEGQIEQHDDPDHPDAATVGEVRDLLAHVQRAVESSWAEYTDAIEEGAIQIVAETDDALVLDTGERKMHEDEIERGDTSQVDGPTMDVLDGVMHATARQHSDHDWGVAQPLVVAKPDGVDVGQRYVESVINGLQRRGLSPGQAWAYYGVEIRGNSKRSWGVRKGDYDHKNVSDALEKAREKLP